MRVLLVPRGEVSVLITRAKYQELLDRQARLEALAQTVYVRVLQAARRRDVKALWEIADTIAKAMAALEVPLPKEMSK